MTVGELKEIIKEYPNDIPIFIQGFIEIKNVNIMEISDKHSKDWIKPKKFVMIFGNNDN